MKTPHKHAELIKAWADGAEIEYRVKDGKLGWSGWKSFESLERFLTDPWWDYRIKPEPKPDVVMTRKISILVEPCDREPNGLVNVTAGFGRNVRFVFDGETRKLKHVEML